VKTPAAILLAACLVGVAGVTGPARAAPCGRPDLVDMVPPDGATGVALNATLGAHYQASADYLGEHVVLVHPGDRKQELEAQFEPTEVFLTVTPTEPLLPGSTYLVRWPSLRGLNAAAAGYGGEATFTTGTSDDTMSPTFAGVVAVEWDLEREQNDCTEELEERYVFDIELGAASDDGGRGGLTLMLFQTSGPGAMAAPVPVSTRALPPEGTRAQVKLPTRNSVGRICFAGLARDTTYRMSQSGSTEACVDTVAPPFFRGCAVAGSLGSAAPAVLLALLALVARRSKT
jgi:hypothetical protein